MARPDRPDGVRVVRTLKDGYWDRTEIVEMRDGSRRVRKSSKGDAPPGPWGVAALRREIAYLSTLPPRARSVFPTILAAWDEPGEPTAAVGYEVPFYADHIDAGELARGGVLGQAEIDAFQDALTEALLDRVHAPLPASDQPLSHHVREVVAHALGTLEADPSLAALIRADSVRLNRQPMAGPRAAFERIVQGANIISMLDAEPQVRLHGDFFLENILWRAREKGVTIDAPELVLIDPVSVAGIMRGPPLFDLVKYVSYAKGELLALRSEWVDVGGFDEGDDGYSYAIRWDAPQLAPYRTRDWHTRLLRAFEARHGAVNRRLYQLIDGYFSVAMAVNTSGVQRRARLLKATADFNAVLSASDVAGA
jgi:hypothetical protein